MASIFARVEGNRIAYYHINSPQGADFWDGHWQSHRATDLRKYYEKPLNGHVGFGQLPRVLFRSLPRNGLILEGGCGLGEYVIALRARGYNCIGVDFAPKTIALVKNYFPDIPVGMGDICRLNLGDETLDAYISLGVVEHFQNGPHAALKEAARVLKKDGILILSIPQAFRWRRQKAHPEGTPLPEGAAFYQYAFSHEEMRKFLMDSGFAVVSEYGENSHYALKLRFSLFRKLLEFVPQLKYIDFILDRTATGKRIGRMRIYVARKA